MVVRGGDVHDAVHHDGRGFHRLQHLGLKAESRLELVDVVGVDLLRGVVAHLLRRVCAAALTVLTASSVQGQAASNPAVNAQLLLAARQSDMAQLERMLAAGSDVNLASLERVTRLIAACYDGQADLVTLLLQAGARTDPIDQMKKTAAV
jgi:ankyrin repeat protein